jgi:hypothetical protein
MVPGKLMVVGFCIRLLFNDADGDQKYEIPPEPLSCIFLPKQIVLSGPALGVGAGFTKTVTESTRLQIPVVAITKYFVVVTGLAMGLCNALLSRVAAGDHTKLSALDSVFNCCFFSSQIVLSGFALSVTILFKGIVIFCVAEQLLLSFTVTV